MSKHSVRVDSGHFRYPDRQLVTDARSGSIVNLALSGNYAQARKALAYYTGFIAAFGRIPKSIAECCGPTCGIYYDLAVFASWCKPNKIGCPSLRDGGESRSRNTMRPPTAKTATIILSPTNSGNRRPSGADGRWSRPARHCGSGKGDRTEPP